MNCTKPQPVSHSWYDCLLRWRTSYQPANKKKSDLNGQRIELHPLYYLATVVRPVSSYYAISWTVLSTTALRIESVLFHDRPPYWYRPLRYCPLRKCCCLLPLRCGIKAISSNRLPNKKRPLYMWNRSTPKTVFLWCPHQINRSTSDCDHSNKWAPILALITLHTRVEVELRTRAFCSGFVWRLQASTAGSRDLVVDVQQAMACNVLTFHPGTICFELKSRSDQPRTRSPHAPQEAVTHSDKLTQTVRSQKEMVGCFNILNS